MARLQLRSYNQILQRLIARTVARSGLSDLIQSSAVRHLLGAFAREIDDVYFQMTRLQRIFSIDTAEDEDLVERAYDIQPGTLQLRGALRANGLIVFSRPTNPGTTQTIPRGTVVQTSSGIQARTDEEAVITNLSVEQITGHGVGRDSNSVSATAINPGASGNVAVGTLTAFVSQPSGISEVTNVSAFTGGRDRESNDEFRERLKNYVASLSRCQVQALEFGVLGTVDPTPLSVKTVQFAKVFEDPIDLGNVIVYVDDGSGTAATRQTITSENVCAGLAGNGVYADVAVGGEEYLTLDNKPVDATSATTPFTLRSRTGDPSTGGSSLRGTLTAGTHYFLNPANGRIFFSPALVAGEFIQADYDYYDGLIQEVQKVVDGDSTDRLNYPGMVAAGVRAVVKEPVIVPVAVAGRLILREGTTRATAVASAQSAVLNYINNVGISGDIVLNELVERIMAVSGVIDVQITAPTANITILDDQLPRSDSSDVILV